MQGNATGQTITLDVLGRPEDIDLDLTPENLGQLFPEIQNANHRAFLAMFAACGNLNRAAKYLGFSSQVVYQWRMKPEFAAAFERAWQMALDRLEAEVYRRACEGTDKPIFQRGIQVGTIREYSDTLAMFLLKGGRPERYMDRFKGEITGEQDVLERLIQGRKRVASMAEAIEAVATTISEEQCQVNNEANETIINGNVSSAPDFPLVHDAYNESISHGDTSGD